MKKITFLAAAIGILVAAPTTTMAEDSFTEALTSGKVSFSARARYESVSQDNTRKDADAFTLRTTLGYKTGDFHGFGAFIEFEDVTELGSESYDSNPSGTDGNNDYSVVADPDGTEVNQAFLSYNGFNTEFKLGRQEITYRGAPFHRYIGNILWRQNHQTFDAFSFTNSSFDKTKINYAYINKVNSIFGNGHDNGLFGIEDGVIDMDSHLVNIQYTGLPIGKLEGYGYLLEYESEVYKTKSSKTLGLRLNGAQAVNDDWKVVYTAEYAKQDDYKSGTMDDQNYYLAELGAKYKGWLAKVSYEMQQGDGTDSFKTLLGTNHAFQGWADMFLSTPAQGLEDIYFTVVGNVLGAKLVAVYHDFETDKGGLDAGDELDLLLQKTFKKHYTVGIKYSDYNADDEYAATVDTEKFWLYGQVKF
ncbi:MAG: hypothetical protein OEW63_00645 [Gammaproteobacteria bacterium]|nr:hypothetical protein [Gammaproteobacteria bacterium]